jgi:hypothetical protein
MQSTCCNTNQSCSTNAAGDLCCGGPAAINCGGGGLG